MFLSVARRAAVHCAMHLVQYISGCLVCRQMKMAKTLQLRTEMLLRVEVFNNRKNFVIFFLSFDHAHLHMNIRY